MKCKQGSSEGSKAALRLSPWAELSLRAFQSHSIGKQAGMMSKQGSGKRPLQERNFEIAANHITITEGQLPQVSRQSVAALKRAFGYDIKMYSGTFHHKAGNDHVHFLVDSEAPKTKSAVKARIAVAMAPIFGTETGSVAVKTFNELKADAGAALGLKGLGDYRSLYRCMKCVSAPLFKGPGGLLLPPGIQVYTPPGHSSHRMCWSGQLPQIDTFKCSSSVVEPLVCTG